MATTTSARQARAMALLAATSAMAAASSATRSPGTSAGLLPARALVTRTPAQIYHLQFSTRRPTASLPATPGPRTRAKTRLASGRRTRTIGTWVGLAQIIKTSGTGAGRPAAAATRTPPGPSALSRRPATAAPLQAARRTMVPGRGGVIAIWTTTWAARHRRATAGRSVRTRTAIIWWPLTGWTKALAALATANATASAWIASAKTKST